MSTIKEAGLKKQENGLRMRKKKAVIIQQAMKLKNQKVPQDNNKRDFSSTFVSHQSVKEGEIKQGEPPGKRVRFAPLINTTQKPVCDLGAKDVHSMGNMAVRVPSPLSDSKGNKVLPPTPTNMAGGKHMNPKLEKIIDFKRIREIQKKLSDALAQREVNKVEEILRNREAAYVARNSRNETNLNAPSPKQMKANISQAPKIHPNPNNQSYSRAKTSSPTAFAGTQPHQSKSYPSSRTEIVDLCNEEQKVQTVPFTRVPSTPAIAINSNRKQVSAKKETGDPENRKRKFWDRVEDEAEYPRSKKVANGSKQSRSSSADIPAALKEAKFKCPDCSAQFIGWQACSEHLYKSGHTSNANILKSKLLDINKQTKEVRYICSDCGAVFNEWRTCASHVQYHPSFASVLAQECQFPRKTSEKGDPEIHHKESPYVEEKLKGKAVNGIAGDHRPSPNAVVTPIEANVRCPGCNKGFSSREDCLLHCRELKHAKYTCKTCSTCYLEWAKLLKHLRESEHMTGGWSKGLKKKCKI